MEDNVVGITGLVVIKVSAVGISVMGLEVVNGVSVVVATGLGEVVLVSIFSVEGELIIIHPSGFVIGAQSVCVGSSVVEETS